MHAVTIDEKRGDELEGEWGYASLLWRVGREEKDERIVWLKYGFKKVG